MYKYKSTINRDLNIKILPPVNNIYQAAPLYFMIPGGGWHAEDIDGMIEFNKISADILRQYGYAAAVIDYRVASDGANMADILDDCFDALRFVADNADKLGIDKNNIITAGHSAGGHLALMLAYTYDQRDIDCNITAVNAMSPPTILHDFGTHNLRDIDDVFRVENIAEEKKKASPFEYVTSKCPPTILSAGTSDRLVFSNSSELLHKKLLENGVISELLLSVGGGHCFEQMHEGLVPKPSFEEIQEKTAEFVLKHTKNISIEG